MTEYWNKNKTVKKVSPPDHYEDKPKQFNYYVYNFTPLNYPVENMEIQRKLAFGVELPGILVPSSGGTCSDGHFFSKLDDNLTLHHQEVLIYDELLFFMIM